MAIEVIETNLIKPLADMFAPLIVFDMPDDLATRIAGESTENKSCRDQLSIKLHILRKGSETCRRFIGIQGLGESVAHPKRQYLQLMKSYNIDIIDDDRSDKLDSLEVVDTPKDSVANPHENDSHSFIDMSVDNPRFSYSMHNVISQVSDDPPPPVDEPTPAEKAAESDYDHIADQPMEAPPFEQKELKKSKKGNSKKKSSRYNGGEIASVLE